MKHEYTHKKPHGVLFICHGNICRSVACEMILRDMVEKRGLQRAFVIDSAATSSEEIGNDIYPPMRATLRRHGVPLRTHRARRMTREDYEAFDVIVAMDEENLYYAGRLWNGDPDGKVHLLMEYAGKPGVEVSDPWYTRDFEATWRDASEGCAALLEALVQSEQHGSSRF